MPVLGQQNVRAGITTNFINKANKVLGNMYLPKFCSQFTSELKSESRSQDSPVLFLLFHAASEGRGIADAL